MRNSIHGSCSELGCTSPGEASCGRTLPAALSIVESTEFNPKAGQSLRPLSCKDSPLTEWSNLPANLWGHVFSVLHQEHRSLLMSTAAVCKSWRCIAYEVILGDTAASKPRRATLYSISHNLVGIPSTVPRDLNKAAAAEVITQCGSALAVEQVTRNGGEEQQSSVSIGPPAHQLQRQTTYGTLPVSAGRQLPALNHPGTTMLERHYVHGAGTGAQARQYGHPQDLNQRDSLPDSVTDQAVGSPSLPHKQRIYTSPLEDQHEREACYGSVDEQHQRHQRRHCLMDGLDTLQVDLREPHEESGEGRLVMEEDGHASPHEIQQKGWDSDAINTGAVVDEATGPLKALATNFGPCLLPLEVYGSGEVTGPVPVDLLLPGLQSTEKKDPRQHNRRILPSTAVAHEYAHRAATGHEVPRQGISAMAPRSQRRGDPGHSKPGLPGRWPLDGMDETNGQSLHNIHTIHTRGLDPSGFRMPLDVDSGQGPRPKGAGGSSAPILGQGTSAAREIPQKGMGICVGSMAEPGCVVGHLRQAGRGRVTQPPIHSRLPAAVEASSLEIPFPASKHMAGRCVAGPVHRRRGRASWAERLHVLGEIRPRWITEEEPVPAIAVQGGGAVVAEHDDSESEVVQQRVGECGLDEESEVVEQKERQSNKG